MGMAVRSPQRLTKNFSVTVFVGMGHHESGAVRRQRQPHVRYLAFVSGQRKPLDRRRGGWTDERPAEGESEESCDSRHGHGEPIPRTGACFGDSRLCLTIPEVLIAQSPHELLSRL